jgi:hypothetical protein
MGEIAIDIVPTETRVRPSWDPLKSRLSGCYMYPQKKILPREILEKLYSHCHITRAHNEFANLRKAAVIIEFPKNN